MPLYGVIKDMRVRADKSGPRRAMCIGCSGPMVS